MPVRFVDEPTFMMLLDLELERARRHHRAFGLTRFHVDHVATHDVDLAKQVAGQIRSGDVALLVDDHLVVLWSESLPVEVRQAIDRIVSGANGSLVEANSVAFPLNALTRAALLGQLFAPPLEVRPPEYSAELVAVEPDDEDGIAV